MVRSVGMNQPWTLPTPAKEALPIVFWLNSTALPVASGEQLQVVLTPAQTARFFRLRLNSEAELLWSMAAAG